ncbi:MAG: 3-hydroxyacyl-CoA dehydrogenase family protein [Lachnospiraceae bacterium]|nr:3-hydroxyacyl-CoA dehydrogenase family protein [Lachnospiraceae bacterium]
MREVKKIVIAGAGTMGISLVQIFAKFDFAVTLYNRSQPSLEKAKKLIDINQQGLILQGMTTAEKSAEAVNKIEFTCNKDCFKDADYVIENIVENMDAKHDFWREISSIAPKDAVLTTNTSGMSITSIAEAVERPERFACMHFWNPPHLVPLVEIIKGEKTCDEAVKVIYYVTEKVNMKPVVLQKEIQGFIGNRLQFAVLREAMHIVESGVATYQDVDKAMRFGLGFRYACIGPFETADLGGLDTFANITSYLFKDLSNAQDSVALKELVADGNLGVKTGKGFYDYSDGKDEQAIRNRDESFIKLYKSLYGEQGE